jgi:hypothetical protein
MGQKIAGNRRFSTGSAKNPRIFEEKGAVERSKGLESRDLGFFWGRRGATDQGRYKTDQTKATYVLIRFASVFIWGDCLL